MVNEILVGQLVRSTAGRDIGKFYLIFDVLDQAFVRVIDGDKKSLNNPKKKNVRHLEFFPEKAEVIADKLDKGLAVSEEEIMDAVKTLGFSHKE